MSNYKPPPNHPFPWTMHGFYVSDANGNEVFHEPSEFVLRYATHAANAYPEIVKALQDMCAAFKPFTFKPIGGEGSDARIEQEAQVVTYSFARGILKALGESEL